MTAIYTNIHSLGHHKVAVAARGRSTISLQHLMPYYCEPGSICQSKQCKNAQSSKAKKCWSQPSARKVMLTVFLITTMCHSQKKPGVNINTDRYANTLKRLRVNINNLIYSRLFEICLVVYTGKSYNIHLTIPTCPRVILMCLDQ